MPEMGTQKVGQKQLVQSNITVAFTIPAQVGDVFRQETHIFPPLSEADQQSIFGMLNMFFPIGTVVKSGAGTCYLKSTYMSVSADIAVMEVEITVAGDVSIVPINSQPFDFYQIVTRKSGSATVGGYAFGGYEACLPPTIVRFLWKLRQKFISKEVHSKLHPLV